MVKYIFFILLSISCFSYAQKTFVNYPPNVNAALTQQEKVQLEEVYGNNLAYLYERPQLLKDIKDYIRNRVSVMHIEPQKAAGSRILSEAIDLNSIPLYDVFNQQLTRDFIYNKNNFNLLKYKIPIFPSEKKLYKLGDYYFTISPQMKKKRN